VLTAVEPVGPGVRVDAGVTTGDEVTLHYDPMIAKLIVLGEHRDDAIGKMQWALRHYVILGDVITNIAFLRQVLSHPRFLVGDTTTDFVEGRGGEDPRPRPSGRGGKRAEAQSPIPNLHFPNLNLPISSSPSPRWRRCCKAQRLQPVQLLLTAIPSARGNRATASGWARPGRVRNERGRFHAADRSQPPHRRG
jgi:hypothetical protein